MFSLSQGGAPGAARAAAEALYVAMRDGSAPTGLPNNSTIIANGLAALKRLLGLDPDPTNAATRTVANDVWALLAESGRRHDTRTLRMRD